MTGPVNPVSEICLTGVAQLPRQPQSRRLAAALRRPALALAVLPSLAVSLASPAYANLINNGGFVPNSNIGSAKSGYLGASNNTKLPGWQTKADWTFPAYVGQGITKMWGSVVGDGTAISTDLDEARWGTADGFPPGLGLNVANTTSVSSADGSGWFLAIDGDQGFGNEILQTVNSLTPGNNYSLSFYQAGGQYAAYPDQATSHWWTVTFGGSGPINSSTINVASGAPVSSWQQQTMTFTANSASQTLSFLAQGLPAGGPPFTLLSGVSLTDITPPPTPSAVPGPLPLLGLAAAFGASRKLRRRIKLG